MHNKNYRFDDIRLVLINCENVEYTVGNEFKRQKIIKILNKNF